MKVCNVMIAPVAVALVALSGSGAIAADAGSQQHVLLQISAKGQTTSRADKVSMMVMGNTDRKSGTPQTLESLRRVVSEFGAKVEVVPIGGSKVGFISNPVNDFAEGQDNSAVTMGQWASYQIVLTEPAKYPMLAEKLSNAGFTTLLQPVPALNDDRAARSAARLDGFNRARSEAMELPAKLNLQFVRITRVDYTCSPTPEPIENLMQAMSFAQGGSGGIEPQNVVTRVTVCLEFEAVSR